MKEEDKGRERERLREIVCVREGIRKSDWEEKIERHTNMWCKSKNQHRS